MSEHRVVADVEIAAPPEDVWRALREPEEIKRWFGWEYEGLDDEVEQIFVDGVSDTDDGRALRFEGGDEFVLEPRDGATTVRVTRTAPMAGALYDEIDVGWLMFAHQLRLMLERHAGQPRRTLRLSGRRRGGEAPGPLEALGLADVAARGTGERYEAVTSVGEPLSGEVWFTADHATGLTVEAYGDGLVIVSTSPAQDDPPHGGASVLLTAYGMKHDAFARLRQRWAGWWEAHVDDPRI